MLAPNHLPSKIRHPTLVFMCIHNIKLDDVPRLISRTQLVHLFSSYCCRYLLNIGASAYTKLYNTKHINSLEIYNMVPISTQSMKYEKWRSDFSLSLQHSTNTFIFTFSSIYLLGTYQTAKDSSNSLIFQIQYRTMMRDWIVRYNT